MASERGLGHQPLQDLPVPANHRVSDESTERKECAVVADAPLNRLQSSQLPPNAEQEAGGIKEVNSKGGAISSDTNRCVAGCEQRVVFERDAAPAEEPERIDGSSLEVDRWHDCCAAPDEFQDCSELTHPVQLNSKARDMTNPKLEENENPKQARMRQERALLTSMAEEANHSKELRPRAR